MDHKLSNSHRSGAVSSHLLDILDLWVESLGDLSDDLLDEDLVLQCLKESRVRYRRMSSSVSYLSSFHDTEGQTRYSKKKKRRQGEVRLTGRWKPEWRTSGPHRQSSRRPSIQP